MSRTIEKGKTLLVNGPASITILSGKAVVFGGQIKNGRKIVIREGKRLPFEAEETTNFDLSLGADSVIEEVEGSTIPQSWILAYNLLREKEGVPVIVMVVGGVDSGKSSFCTYLTNKLAREKRKAVVLDEDLGQSDIGPPSTVAYALVEKPTTDLFDLKPENMIFVGVTSPSDATDKTVEAVAFLKAEILNNQMADYVIVNTDGWMQGDDAVHFKSRLANTVEPGLVFCLQDETELPSGCAALGDALGKFIEERIDSPVSIRGRNKEERRSLRELGFVKYLENSKVRVFALNHVPVEGKESNALIWQHKAKNLLIGLYNGKRKFLGIGVIRGVDYARKAIKVQTSVRETPAFLIFGRVRLDGNLRETQEKTES